MPAISLIEAHRPFGTVWSALDHRKPYERQEARTPEGFCVTLQPLVKGALDMRIAAYNVENLFDRAKVFNDET
ncbi:MAG: hypothetical protein AAGK82_11925, partial [Pseudomonadota bacterium]